MSIATRTGDNGTTGLMYNRRVRKTDPRVEACGTIDELNAAIGLARANNAFSFTTEFLLPVQRDLIVLMGEVATAPADLTRYEKDGFQRVAAAMTTRLDECVAEIERQKVSFAGWATPGSSVAAATLDFARTTCRRAERRVCALQEAAEVRNPEIVVYLNRLSDALWLMARWVEAQSAGSESGEAKGN